MTRQEYYKIREKIGIKQQVQTFLKYVMDMCEIYPQFNQVNYHRIKMVVCHKTIRLLTIGWLTAPCHLGAKIARKWVVLLTDEKTVSTRW